MLVILILIQTGFFDDRLLQDLPHPAQKLIRDYVYTSSIKVARSYENAKITNPEVQIDKKIHDTFKLRPLQTLLLLKSIAHGAMPTESIKAIVLIEALAGDRERAAFYLTENPSKYDDVIKNRNITSRELYLSIAKRHIDKLR